MIGSPCAARRAESARRDGVICPAGESESRREALISEAIRAPRAKPERTAVLSATVTVTRREILTALNKPDDFILALVEVDGDSATPRYVRNPFQREPDFAANSVNYELRELIQKSTEPN